MMNSIKTYEEWFLAKHPETITPRIAYYAALEEARKATLVNKNYDPCCGLAKQQLGCVCRVVWVCPLHGEAHIGTHD